MLAVNGKVLNLNSTDPNDPNRVHIDRVLEGYKTIALKYRYPIRLKYPERFKIVHSDQPNAKPRWPGGRYISFKEIVSTPTGGVMWQYYENVKDKSNNTQEFLPDGFMFSGTLDVPSTKKDLAFFLLMCSSHCENSVNNDLNDGNLDNKYFVVENRKIEALDKLMKEESSVRAKSLILFDSSEDTIRAVAPKYGLLDAQNKEKYSIEEVRHSVWNMVERMAKQYQSVYDIIRTDLGAKPKKQPKEEDENKKPEIFGGEEDERAKLFKEVLDAGIIKLENTGKIYRYMYRDTGRMFARCYLGHKTPEDCFIGLAKRLYNQPGLWDELKKVSEVL